MTSAVRLKSLEARQPPEVRRRRVATSHRAQDPVVAGLKGHVEVASRRGGLAKRRDQVVVHVVDLDRRESEPLQTGHSACLADEPRQREAGVAIPEAPEVDPGQDDLAMALTNPLLDLGEHGRGTAAARGTAYERDHAEGAAEAAAVLHLDERTDPIEARVRLHAPDCTHVPCHRFRDLFASPGDDDDVFRKTLHRLVAEVRRTAGHVDPSVRPCRPGSGLAGLRHRLVRDAARVHHRNIRPIGALVVSVRDQPLTQRLSVRVGHLAAEEPDREGGHSGRESTRARTDRPPTRRRFGAHDARTAPVRVSSYGNNPP